MMSQMNVRINEKLRAEGNLAFEEVGWSPSQAVRALWGYAARNRRDPRKLREMQRFLDGAPASASDQSQPSEAVAARVSKTQGAVKMVQDELAELGIDLHRHDPTPLAELKEQAFVERWAERGLL